MPRIGFCFLCVVCVLACVIGVGRGLTCDEGEGVQKCVDEYDFCQSREAAWPDDPSVLCPLCVPTFGACLNATQCYGTSWARYTSLCKRAACTSCLTAPANAANTPSKKPLTGMDAIRRVLVSLLLATILLVLAGSFALKLSW